MTDMFYQLADGAELPTAEDRADIEADLDFAQACASAVDITAQTLELVAADLAVARERHARAEASAGAAARAKDIADQRLTGRMRQLGLVRTAGGIMTTAQAEAAQAAPAAEPSAEPSAELRLGGRNPGLYVDGERIQ